MPDVQKRYIYIYIYWELKPNQEYFCIKRLKLAFYIHHNWRGELIYAYYLLSENGIPVFLQNVEIHMGGKLGHRVLFVAPPFSFLHNQNFFLFFFI